ncbi:aspartic peptidase domain-containing protein [Blakeslea trispora]|nr:aspartic peptidase domain-containing protein [Blakeslea trispora]
MRSSGILGLAFPSLMSHPVQEGTFILNLVKNKLIAEPVFSIYLNRQQADNVSYVGEMVLGGYETSRFTGAIQFLPLVSYHSQTGQPLLGHAYSSTQGTYKYWTVPGQAVAYRDKDNQLIYETQLPDIEPAILDTGTTLSYMPGDTVLTLLKLVTANYTERKTSSGSLVYEVNCNDFSAQDRWFDFMFSNRQEGFSSNPVTIRVPLIEMALPQADVCLFGIAPISTGFLSSVGSGWILGQTVLRSAYVVHDMVGYQVGIGAASNGYESPIINQSSSHALCCQPFCFLLICVTVLCLTFT